MSDLVLIEDSDGVRLLTFNRPDKLNAFNSALYRAAGDALIDASERDDVKCVVMTGAGRAFSAGQDLEEMAGINTAEEGAEMAHGFPHFLDNAATFSKPLLAAVNGVGVGIGMTMLLQCDIVLIADTARLRAPFVPLGVVPEAGSSVLMPAIMGNQRAAVAFYTGDWLSADDAVAANLALRAVPADQVVEQTMAIARQIAALPLTSLVETKGLVLAGRLDAFRAARAREDVLFQRLMTEAANKTALAEFLGQ
jgi:enoyl-CoA hydratase/carnithine racemase